MLLVETVFDSLNSKAALVAIEKCFEDAGRRLPLMVSFTITDKSGRTLSGQTVEAYWNSVSNHRLLSIGINCALGPKEMRPFIEELAGLADIYVSAHPNAGLPNPMLPTGFPGDAGDLRAAAPGMGRQRLAQHRGRLLRHYAGAHQAPGAKPFEACRRACLRRSNPTRA